MQHPKKLLSLALAAGFALAGCDADHTGSGHWQTQERSAADFTRVEVSGAVQLFVEVDPDAEPQIVVAGDDNLLGFVQTDVSAGILQVETDGWLNPHHSLEVWVRTRNLRGLDLSGASGVTAWGIASKRLDVDVSGASEVRLAGKVNDLRFDGSGASRLRAAALRGDAVDLEASGATQADVCVRDMLRIDVSGASAVRYFGPVQDVKQEASGASEVEFGGAACASFTPPTMQAPSGDCTCGSAGGGTSGGNGYDGAGWGDDSAGAGSSGGSGDGGAGGDGVGTGGSAGDNPGTDGTGPGTGRGGDNSYGDADDHGSSDTDDGCGTDDAKPSGN